MGSKNRINRRSGARDNSQNTEHSLRNFLQEKDKHARVHEQNYRVVRASVNIVNGFRFSTQLRTQVGVFPVW